MTTITITLPDDGFDATMDEKARFADFVAERVEALYPDATANVCVGPALATTVYLHGAEPGDERDLADLVSGPWFSEWCAQGGL